MGQYEVRHTTTTTDSTPAHGTVEKCESEAPSKIGNIIKLVLFECLQCAIKGSSIPYSTSLVPFFSCWSLFSE